MVAPGQPRREKKKKKKKKKELLTYILVHLEFIRTCQKAEHEFKPAPSKRTLLAMKTNNPNIKEQDKLCIFHRVKTNCSN